MKRHIMFLYVGASAHGGFDDVLKNEGGEVISFDEPKNGFDHLPSPQGNTYGYDVAHVVDTETWKVVMTFELGWTGKMIEDPTT